MVAVDRGMGDLVALARIDEMDRSGLFAWLVAWKEGREFEVLIGDDFNGYSSAPERLDLEYLICRLQYLRYVSLLNNLKRSLAMGGMIL